MPIFKAIFKRSRERDRRLDEIEATLQENDSLICEREPRVNFLVAWLEARKSQNGFGQDFEWTLNNPRGKGAAS